MNRPFSNHRPFPSGRIVELLETLKTEYETLSRETNTYKLQRDEYERKLQQQVQESQNLQTQIFELERNHQRLKQKYEEEILVLKRRQLTQSGSEFSPPNNNIPGEKRTLSVEIGTQDLGNLSKRNIEKHRELPAPFNFGINNNNNNNNGSFGPSPLSTIVRPTSVKRTPLVDGPKLPPPPSSLSSPSSSLSPSQSTVPTLLLSSTSTIFQNPTNGHQKKYRKSPETETEGNDWVVGYNPGVTRKLDVKLDYDMDHDSVVCCVNFSSDGKYLATGCNHSAQIFDVYSGEKIHTFQEKQDQSDNTDLYIRSVCFSPDGKYLATGAEDKTVKLWEIEKELQCLNFVGHELDIYSLHFSPDGKFVISGSGDKKVKIWSIEEQKCVYTLGDDLSGPKDGVTSVAISPDGSQVAAGSLDRTVRVWDAETGQLLGQYEGHTDSVYAVAFSPDGKSLASGSLDRTLKIWDLNRNRPRCRVTLSGHRDFVLSVAFSPDGSWLVSGSKDRSVQFWDPRTSITHMILQGHRNSVISVALTGEKDGTIGKFATGSGDWRARIWQYKAGAFS